MAVRADPKRLVWCTDHGAIGPATRSGAASARIGLEHLRDAHGRDVADMLERVEVYAAGLAAGQVYAWDQLADARTMLEEG